MISTDDRSPTATGSPPPDSTTTRLNFNNNNEDTENNRLYYQYAPASASSSPPRDSPLQQLTSSQSTPSISTPASPLLQHRQYHNSYNNLNQHHQQPIVLRDPNSSPVAAPLCESSSTAVALPSSSPPATINGITDFIHHTLSSRLIPKLGSIVKRFSLNYSGEGLVTDRQRTRTVRVGIRFQVQVDSFINNRLENGRPRAILRTQSAPVVDQLDSGFSSPTTDVFPPNTQLALEYNHHQPSSIKNISQSQSNSSSTLSVGGSSVDYTCSGAGSSNGIQIGIGSGVDSCSSCVSSEASSPTLERRANLTWPLRDRHNHNHSEINQSSDHHPNSNTLAFHNRINQALNSYRNNQQQQQSADNQQRTRRSSVQVYRRGSASPERSSSISSPAEHNSMEDSSSYQVLRHFPGSNVNSLNELSWETAAFEKEIRDRIQWLGDKVSSIRVPRVINQLIEFGKDYARENPVTALILLALCLTSSAPVLIFLVFAVLTILVTFLGFLFVEGTLLTGATVIFGGVIILVGFITLSAVLLGMLGYFTTTQAYLVVTGRSQIFRLLRKIPIIGNLFPEPPVQSDDNSNQYSNLLGNGNVSSSVAGGGCPGRLANGHGPYNKTLSSSASVTTTPYYVDEEEDVDDIINDILDSEEDDVAVAEIEQEAEIKKIAELKNTTTPTSTTDEVNDLSGSSSSVASDVEQVVEEPELEEDLGNQEIVSSTLEENGIVEEEETAELNTGKTLASAEVEGKCTTPVILVNGHHNDVEPESEINAAEESVA